MDSNLAVSGITSSIFGIVVILQGLVFNFLFAGMFGCCCFTGCCNCYTAGLMFVAAMTFAHEISTSTLCIENFEPISENKIYEEKNGECYEYDKGWTIAFSVIYYIGIGAFVLGVGLYGLDYLCSATEDSEKPQESEEPTEEEIGPRVTEFKF